MNIHVIYAFFMKRFRPQRAKEISARFPLLYDPRSKILDVGGGGGIHGTFSIRSVR